MTTSEIKPAAYQLVPLSKLVSNGLNGILIADGVGLGKTISACLAASYYSEIQAQPTAVICSPILVTKWITELKSKFGISAFAVRSKEDLATAKTEMRVRPLNFYVLGSSLLANLSNGDLPYFGLSIFDEIHNYRNNKTKTYSSALMLARQSGLRIGLSATPINNSLDDLASEIALVLAESNWEAVSAMISDLWTWNRKQITRPLVTRFTKDKLSMHFAKRNVTMIDVVYPLEYTETVNRALGRLVHGSSVYEIVTYLRLAASCPHAFLLRFRLDQTETTDPKLVKVQTILDSCATSHWLLFVEFEATARYLASSIKRKPIFIITGKTPMFDRDEIIDDFRNSKIGVLILTPVGGEGLDLQFCEGVINYDLHWNPMRIEQRIGRIDRIGQTKTSIDIFNVRVVDSIDDHVLRVLFRKLDLTQKSIFVTGDILKPSSAVSSALRERAVDFELDESAKVVAALEYSDSIDQDDFSLLPSLDDSFCNPTALRETARREPLIPAWIKSTPHADAWRTQIKDEATRFLNGLRQFK